MNKCLNCGKDVQNKFCNVSCQNTYKGKLNKENYYKNPKLCKCCGKVIDFEKKENKYCSQSCATKTNNIGTTRNSKTLLDTISDELFTAVIQNSVSWRDISLNLGYTSNVIPNTKTKIIERCEKLGISWDFNKKLIKENSKKLIKEGTKQEIFKDSKNWQSARTTIRKDAVKVYRNSEKEYKCYICGYNNHVEIAHIKAVSEFNDDATMEEINHIDNLIALCPNHHWEYDNGKITI